MYVEIEATMIDRDGNDMSLSIPRESISYYRGYVSTEKEGKDRSFVMVFLKGNDRPIKIISTLDAFKRKCAAKHINIDLAGFSDNKVENLKEHIAELRKD